MPSRSNRHLSHALEVFGLWGDDDVHILGSTDDPPGVHGQTTHHDELNLRSCEASQKLIEGRLAQLVRAAPVNRINLWLSAIPSAKFTLMGRCASSRNRRTRTASAVAAGDGRCPFIDRNASADPR
jgi:hypothetical protein